MSGARTLPRSAGPRATRLEADAERWSRRSGNTCPCRTRIPSALRDEVRRRGYVLHAFEKKTQKTSGRDVDLAKQRLTDLIRIRREEDVP